MIDIRDRSILATLFWASFLTLGVFANLAA